MLQNRRRRPRRWTSCFKVQHVLFLLVALFLAPLHASSRQPKQPKQEKFSTLRKNARTALKNQSGQDAARDALLGALSRPGLSEPKRAEIHYIAAQLEESLNAVENRKAYLRQAYDTARFFNKLRDMYEQLRLCDSIDVLPDAKGRIRPRLHKRTNALRRRHCRNIFYGGRYYLSHKDYAAAYPFFDAYSTYVPTEGSDTLLSQAVVWATMSAFLTDNYAATIKHVDRAIACTDSSTASVLHEYKVRSFAKLGDEQAWVEALETGVARYPEHDYFFVQLADWYHGRRDFARERLLADRLIAHTGGRAIHYYAKSKSFLAEENYTACIAQADSTIACQADFVDAYYNKGISFLNMAVISAETSCKDATDPRYAADKRRTQELYRQARPCMEMVRRLQPEKMERWAPALYRIYLNLNLGEEFLEIDRLLNPGS